MLEAKLGGGNTSEKPFTRNNDQVRFVRGTKGHHSNVSVQITLLLTLLIWDVKIIPRVGAIREASELQNMREDVFSSTAKLEELVSNELQILELLQTFTDYVTEKTNLIKRYVENQKKFLESEKTAKETVAHPVNAYVLVRRLTVEWDDVNSALHAVSNYSTGVYQWITGFREGNNFPQADDLNGAAQALVRLQDTYLLDLPSLANGVVTHRGEHNSFKFQAHNGLTARDMLFLGKHAYSHGLYNRAIQWFKEAQILAAVGEPNGTLLAEITPSLRSAIETHDDVLERQGPRGINWKTNPTPINPTLAKNNKYNLNRTEQFQTKLFQRQNEDEELEHYTRLCRGERLRPPILEAHLRCRLKQDGNPYLTISPLKIEEESHDPYIVIVHDFITEKQADSLVELGKPKLHRSRHRHHREGSKDVVSQKRISKNAWIKDWEDKLMIKITRRVELISGLKAFQPKEAEDYQIANYGIAGLYVPHTDHLMNNPDKTVYTSWERFVGDRIATLMIYLSDVKAGGRTVFPRAGVTLTPKKGAAALWWNLLPSGVGDDNTRHGACPVLYGDKWVSNKWIRYNEQLRSAPCLSHPLMKYQRP